MDETVSTRIPILHKSLRPEFAFGFNAACQQYGEETANKWSKDGCGIASVASVVESIRRSTDPTFRLPSVTTLCEEYRERAYIPGTGWRHSGLLTFAHDFGLDAFNLPACSAAEVATHLQNGWIPVVSVTLFFRGGETFTDADGNLKTRAQGGHLVTLTGAHLSDGALTGFLVCDCQSLTASDGETQHPLVSLEAFNRSFSGKALFFRGA